ncbi:MAG TPA: beta-propeller fold lactonase family protein [Nitrospiria bacterium]|nr:beta-propeller fold lactonase family protein [Nitrospiria bacterium]
MKMRTLLAIAALLLPLWAGTSLGNDRDTHDKYVHGAVYAMTNASDGNEIVIFDRDEDGMLTKAGSVSTQGTGSGDGLDPLGSQGSLILSRDERWLLAVNAGSSEISVFRVRPYGLELTDKVESGGTFPVSLTLFHDLVYVLNAGGDPNITGFGLSHRGKLTPLAHSTRALGNGGFAQVGFDPQGETLVVTDKANNKILVFDVGRKGLPGIHPVASPSNGQVPFAFLFDRRGHLLVTEAASNAVSSYEILSNGFLRVISPSVANGQTATCWIAANERGEVFTTSPGTSAISAYRLFGRKGRIALIDGTAGIGIRPLDLAITGNGRFLYTLDPGNGTVQMFEIQRHGRLVDLGTVDGGFSIFAQGIAAR